ncbi:MAG: hypothetical protein KatS3mg038_3117 [Candidatus Kapaibacterium sp.]|nr:MAG: hypothetical protein KatS3mg038_2386 [Candidatus Kapabacteria bacterium]GIV52596.1 MAG: hypothetical protein KatS3mg038_3117 [Candidatus Kapabacteria bacterium]
MARYLLNSAVITAPGLYRYSLIDVEQAKRWLDGGDPPLSTIRYEQTAVALGMLVEQGDRSMRSHNRDAPGRRGAGISPRIAARHAAHRSAQQRSLAGGVAARQLGAGPAGADSVECNSHTPQMNYHACSGYHQHASDS